MRNPNEVLNNLVQQSSKENYVFKRLYRNLYNEDFFLLAYQNIYAKEGNLTKGTDGKTIDGMSLERINNLIESIKEQSYQPNPARRVYIPKKNGGQRSLGIPSVNDKLIQEVVRNILESIYEKSFKERSHGFRPNRSCHTALTDIQKKFIGVKWFIEGDIKGFFDNIDHHVLINILRKKIEDEKFINLIWKFLKAGYLEDWTYHNTYSGTPQGGIISPILSNIYLNELDKYMDKKINEFNKGNERKRNSEYRKQEKRLATCRAKYKEKWGELNENEKREAIKEIKTLKSTLLETQYYNPMDSNYKRIRYARYADDFLVGIIGSKEDAIKIKEDLTVFLKEQLKLELSQEKTLITHSSKKARFLSYDITVSRDENASSTKNGVLKRNNNYKVKLYVPKEKWVKNLTEKGCLKIINDDWKPMHRAYLISYDDLEILSIYNAEIRGLYKYYKLANNVSVLNKHYFIMKYSMLKTFANKYKTSVKKIIKKYNVNGEFGIEYDTKKGKKTRVLYNKGFRRQQIPELNNIDKTPDTQVYSGRTSLIERLKAEKCEWCGKVNTPLEVHHVRKLKDLKGKKTWEKIMISRNRKTIALCKKCHDDLHAGRLD
ncbi:reverse transcriptase domain-containing protein [Cytobacillus firmus]|uniref:reverse transcriptase domain-containing protein n=1 Tax=Cytobacillus firmus TaxID=1399 RepID=UPI0018CE049C|nr:reverse transcriptase domain-containing protein [Cytobacillus firmus]MBG9587685.1 hypothetical protein [Cytobacillus firmus]